MKVELKNAKVNNAMSEETTCFSATIYVDGKRVGTVLNRGNGAPHEYDIPDLAMERRLEEYARTCPSVNASTEHLDYLIAILLDRFELRARLTKFCRSGIAYKEQNTGADSWIVAKVTREQFDAYLAKHPEKKAKIAIIANDDIDVAVEFQIKNTVSTAFGSVIVE